jgi:excinuclease UvrABC nuclease subunit
MKKVAKQKIIRNLNSLPETPGVLKFLGDKDILFLSKTSNLKRAISKYLVSRPEAEQVMKMISLCKEVSWQEENSLLAALITEKLELIQEIPQFNHLLKKENDYVYLRIAFHQVPYFAIAENTLKEQYYIGPFFNRFFPLDVVDILNQLKKYPACENSNYPCYMYSEGSCTGWCLKDTAEVSEVIVKNYLVVNRELLQELRDRQQQHFDELDFEQENILKDKISILEKYYDFLQFFHIIKHLDQEFSYNGNRLKISHGQIESIINTSGKYEFAVRKTDYRTNELLALEKDQMAEAWIVYNYLKKKYSQKIISLYLASAQKLQREMGF